MRSIPVGEFKDNASAFIAAAEAGEEIVITRHGKPAARIVPAALPDDRREQRFDRLWEGWMARLDGMRATGQTATDAERTAWKREGQR